MSDIEQQIRRIFGGKKVIIIARRRAEHELAEIILHHISGLTSTPVPRDLIDEYGRPAYLLDRVREYLVADESDRRYRDFTIVGLDTGQADVWYPVTEGDIYITRKFQVV